VDLLSIGRKSSEICPGFSAIAPELVEEEHVADEHVEEAHPDVEEFTESELHLVFGVAGFQLDEVVGDDACLGIPFLYDLMHQVAFHTALPQDTGNLGETDAECEEERDPEIVGSHSAVPFIIRHGILINETTSRLALQMRLQITSPVDPAVRSGIVVRAVAVDGSPIEMVLQEHEHEPEHEDGCGEAMVDTEQEVVDLELLATEPLEEVLEYGQLPEGHGRRHCKTIVHKINYLPKQ